MRLFALPILACLAGVLGLAALSSSLPAQTAPAPAAAVSSVKTLFFVRTPDRFTAIRAVSFQRQGAVLVLVDDAGGRAVVQMSTVAGHVPWFSDEEIAGGKVDLAALATAYETYALRLPAMRKLLTDEAARFRGIVEARANERLALEKAAADRLAAATSAVYRPEAGYDEAALEAILSPADEVRSARPETADRIDRWAAPFRDHLLKLKAGSRYENGGWVTREELAQRVEAEREAAFRRGLDHELPAEVLSASVVRGLVLELLAAAAAVFLVGVALVVFMRHRGRWRLAGAMLVAASPLALAALFFLATRTPDFLPGSVATDESPAVISALADAAGITPDPPATRSISDAALNSFLSRHVRLARPDAFDPWSATRQAIAARSLPGRLMIFELVRCLGLTWIVRYDLGLEDQAAPVMAGVRIGALDCPPSLAAQLWKNLGPRLQTIFTAGKITGHFAVRKPADGVIQLAFAAPAATPAPAPIEPPPPAPAGTPAPEPEPPASPAPPAGTPAISNPFDAAASPTP